MVSTIASAGRIRRHSSTAGRLRSPGWSNQPAQLWCRRRTPDAPLRLIDGPTLGSVAASAREDHPQAAPSDPGATYLRTVIPHLSWEAPLRMPRASAESAPD